MLALLANLENRTTVPTGDNRTKNFNHWFDHVALQVGRISINPSLMVLLSCKIKFRTGGYRGLTHFLFGSCIFWLAAKKEDQNQCIVIEVAYVTNLVLHQVRDRYIDSLLRRSRSFCEEVIISGTSCRNP